MTRINAWNASRLFDPKLQEQEQALLAIVVRHSVDRAERYDALPRSTDCIEQLKVLEQRVVHEAHSDARVVNYTQTHAD
jgi:hypothetical protein